jgi:hypothetical protein
MFDDRSAGKATVVTRQLPIEHWHGWIGDETLADAMLDRLMQRHHWIAFTGELLRKAFPKPNKLEPELDQNGRKTIKSTPRNACPSKPVTFPKWAVTFAEIRS